MHVSWGLEGKGFLSVEFKVVLPFISYVAAVIGSDWVHRVALHVLTFLIAQQNPLQQIGLPGGDI